MPREVLVLLVGISSLLATIYVIRYLCRRWSIPIKVRTIVMAILSAFSLNLGLLLVTGATWDMTLFFSLAGAWYTGAYLWLRNKQRV